MKERRKRMVGTLADLREAMGTRLSVSTLSRFENGNTTSLQIADPAFIETWCRALSVDPALVRQAIFEGKTVIDGVVAVYPELTFACTGPRGNDDIDNVTLSQAILRVVAADPNPTIQKIKVLLRAQLAAGCEISEATGRLLLQDLHGTGPTHP